jgi:hypothetical protein
LSGKILRRLFCTPVRCSKTCHGARVKSFVTVGKKCVLHKLITADGITVYMVEDCSSHVKSAYFHENEQLPGGGCDDTMAYCYSMAGGGTLPPDNTMTISQPSLPLPTAVPAPAAGVTSVASGAYRFTHNGRTRTIKWHKLTVGGHTLRVGFEIAPMTPDAPFALRTIVRGMAVFEVEDSDPLPIRLITRP